MTIALRRTATSALVAVVAPMCVASTLVAQSAQCSAQPLVSRDACQKGTDLFLVLAPQVTGAVAGGGAVLGTARAVGGLSLGLRLNVVDGRLPDMASLALSTNGLVRSSIATTRAPIPMPTLDAAFSVVPGVRVGRFRVLAADVLVNVSYLPTLRLEDFDVRAAKGSIKLGYGGRIGVLNDTRISPAIAISYFRRTLPTAGIVTSLPTNLPSNAGGSALRDSIALSELSLRADALRLSVSKRIGFLEIGGGVGQDRQRAFTQLRTRVTPVVLGAPLPSVVSAYVVTQALVRNAAYGSLALNFGRVHVGAEVGSSFGGDSVSTYNTFAAAGVNSPRRFGSLGLRVSF